MAKLTELFLPLEHDVKRAGQPIIKSLKGGKQVSKEGFDHDVNVVWVMEFEVGRTTGGAQA